MGNKAPECRPLSDLSLHDCCPGTTAQEYNRSVYNKVSRQEDTRICHDKLVEIRKNPEELVRSAIRLGFYLFVLFLDRWFLRR